MTDYSIYVAPQLRKMLEDKGLFTGGKREALESRLKEHDEQIKRNENLEERARLADKLEQEVRTLKQKLASIIEKYNLQQKELKSVKQKLSKQLDCNKELPRPFSEVRQSTSSITSTTSRDVPQI